MASAATFSPNDTKEQSVERLKSCINDLKKLADTGVHKSKKTTEVRNSVVNTMPSNATRVSDRSREASKPNGYNTYNTNKRSSKNLNYEEKKG